MKILKKTLLCLAVLSIWSTLGFAQNQATVYQQLCQLNKYWQEHPMDISLMEECKTFENEGELIALHLELVEAHLRQNPSPNLSVSQKANRLMGLDILKDYWQTRVFPINTRHAYTIPYFIDDFNTACAVGHIMREGTGAALAASIADEDNYAYIEQMHNPEITRWATANGFTEKELRWIQPDYGPNITMTHIDVEPTCNNNNGEIDITVSSPFMPPEGYEFEWREGIDMTKPVLQTTEDFVDAESGFYSITIPGNGNGGQWDVDYIKHFSLSDLDGPTIVATVTHHQCYSGEADGSISLEIDDDYSSIKWYDYENNLIAENVTEVNGLEGGLEISMFTGQGPTYTARVEVVDAMGCKTLKHFVVDVLSAGPYFPNWDTEVTPVDCNSNGSIELGNIYSENYDVLWNDGSTSEYRSNLSVGTYTLTITDEAGCSLSRSYLIENVCETAADSSCINLTGLDFGICDSLLGIALVDGECVSIKGCSTVATNGIDYKDYILNDTTVCTEVCGGTVPAHTEPEPIVSGINEQKLFNNQLSVYPNPLNYSAVLESSFTMNNASLIWYNMFGQIEREQSNISGSSIVLIKEDLPAGMYTISLIQDDAIINAVRVMVID